MDALEVQGRTNESGVRAIDLTRVDSGELQRQGTRRVSAEEQRRSAPWGEAYEAVPSTALSPLVGDSPTSQRLREQVRALSAQSGPVLIVGEAGAGKRHVARALHLAMGDPNGIYFGVRTSESVNAILGEELPRLEASLSQLAATGVEAHREVTVVFEDIALLPLAAQSRILEAIQRFGGMTSEGGGRVRARFVATSEWELTPAALKGRVLSEFCERFSQHVVRLPALRQRKADVAALAQHFLEKECERSARQHLSGFSGAAMAQLIDYEWPGNIRELREVVEGAVACCRGKLLELQDLGLVSQSQQRAELGAAELPAAGIDLRNAVEAFENRLIRQALERTRWNKNQAAKLLGLNRTTLVEMLKRKKIRAA